MKPRCFKNIFNFKVDVPNVDWKMPIAETILGMLIFMLLILIEAFALE